MPFKYQITDVPLKVIIVGAGLGGLGCAVALARAGHHIEVFEQSSFLNEVGAAIHIPPNATRVLKSWGCDFDDLNPVYCQSIKGYDKDGNPIFEVAKLKELQKQLGIEDQWLLTHRVDLHTTLRNLAMDEKHANNIKIHLASRVVTADAELAKITLDNGETHKGDLLIGADGIHSRVVAAVAQEKQRKKSTGQNCFRFLVPMEEVNSNTLTGPLFKKLGLDSQHVYLARDRRLVIYPCRDRQLINVVAIHPAEASGVVGESAWLDGGKLSDLLDTYKDFSPGIVELCSLAEDLKLWSLATRDPPRSFFRGITVLVGDAAHPMLPHQGQGGAQSFEDGAALGALLPLGTTPDQIPERLQAYNRARYERAVTVMFMSRVNDERRGEMMDDLHKYVPDAQLPGDMFAYTWDSYPAEAALRELHQKETASKF